MEMKMRRWTIAAVLAIVQATVVTAAKIDYTKSDSLKVCQLLTQAKGQEPETNYMVYFARQLKDVPYVGQTLERNKTEQLVINLQELDCTTYVENCMALTLCMKANQLTFEDFCHYLQTIRYAKGAVDYPSRNHYFTQWILSNTANGLVEEVNLPPTVPSLRQTIQVTYMSAHPDLYPMLKDRQDWQRQIKENENAINGMTFAYIPKNRITNSDALRKTISDGDILAIVTSKAGLDTSHIGIAVWHQDGLHLLNASSIHKKTVEEPMTLQTYMSKHPSQQGIRVIRLK